MKRESKPKPIGSSTENFVSARGQGWTQPVICPGCGEQATTHRAPPRFRCGDVRCGFRYGWRLRFGADFGEQDTTKLFAVPITEDGELDYSRAKLWHVEGAVMEAAAS